MGVIFLAIYLYIIGRYAQKMLAYYFGLRKNWRTYFLGLFLSLSTWGYGLGGAVIFYKLNGWSIFFTLLFNAILWLWLGKNNVDEISVIDVDTISETVSPTSFSTVLLAILYITLNAFGLKLLINSQSNGVLSSPWQAIDAHYIIIFAVSTLLLGLIIFSKLRVITLLWFLIFHTFLLHSYLPLTHELFYGADGWRHLANEQRILAQLPFRDANLSANTAGWKTMAGELSYGQLWGISAAIGNITTIDLISINKWLVPIIWSLVFPILLFEIGWAFGWGRRQSLFFVWLAFLPFALQVSGSFTLPNNFSFLMWALLFLLLIKRLQQHNRKQIVPLVILGGLGIFGYSLYFILFFLAWAFLEICYHYFFVTTPKGWLEGTAKELRGRNKWFFVPITILFGLFFPALELVSHYSQINKNINWLAQFKQLFGTIFTWYLATGPRPQDISAGNIIFNQTPIWAFVPNFFTSWHFWIFLVSSSLFALGIYAGFIFWTKKQSLYLFIGLFAVAIFISYIISRYFLFGENIFTRRLDAVLALFAIILLSSALEKIIASRTPAYLASMILLFTIFISASYSLGPDTGTVSADEYRAMQYVWSQEKNFNNHCVIASTYPLLALETISRKQIIGGGFPIDQYYSQPELTRLYGQMQKDFSQNLIQEASILTKTDHCWLVSSVNIARPVDQAFGKVGAWKFNK